MSYKKIQSFAKEMRKRPTPAEAFFWKVVRRRQFLGKRFNRQFVIQHEEWVGRKKFFIADFYCHAHRLIVEIDGKIHDKQIEYDRIREDILIGMGFQILRFSNEEVLNEWEMVAKELEMVLM